MEDEKGIPTFKAYTFFVGHQETLHNYTVAKNFT